MQVSHTVSSTFSVHEQAAVDGGDSNGPQKLSDARVTPVVTLRHPSLPV